MRFCSKNVWYVIYANVLYEWTDIN